MCLIKYYYLINNKLVSVQKHIHHDLKVVQSKKKKLNGATFKHQNDDNGTSNNYMMNQLRRSITTIIKPQAIFHEVAISW